MLQRLDLDEISRDDRWVHWHGEPGADARNLAGRLFGGMVLAQTIMAAGRCLPDRRIHSLQQMFLRGGVAEDPLTYKCEMLFTGRTYAAIRVEIHQNDEIISHAQVGVTAGVEGPDRQSPSPATTKLEHTINRDELMQRRKWQDQAIEVRVEAERETDAEPNLDTWLRPRGPLPDDQLVHQAMLSYVSDRAFLRTAWKPHAAEWGPFKGATLDHTIWFHRPVRFDDWHVFSMESPAMIDGRGMNHGVIHDSDGTLIASLSQQGAMRSTTKP